MKTLLAISILLGGTWAGAQSTFSAQKPPTEIKSESGLKVSESYKALVKQLMVATHTVENQNKAIEDIAANVAKDAKDPAKARKSAFKYFNDVLGIEAMLPEISESYARHFSEAELKKLVAFYKTPVGEKAAKSMPEITRDITMKAQIRMQMRMPEFNKEKVNMEGFK